jgi:hypothetical protein
MVTDYRHGIAERLDGELHEAGRRLIHLKNQSKELQWQL